MTKAGAAGLGNKLRGEIRIPLGGKMRLLKFSLNALASYSQRYNISIEDMQRMSAKRMTLQQLRDVLFFALAEGYRIEGKEVDFTELEVGDWLQDAGGDKLKEIFKAYEGATALPGGGKAETRETKN